MAIGAIGLFILWVVLSSLVGVYANSKGRSEAGYIFLSLLISPLLGFLVVLMLEPNQAKIEQRMVKEGKVRKCPACAELVRPDAAICKRCGKELPT